VPIPGNERTVFLSTQYQRPPIDVERVTVRGRVAGVWFASRS
jgi:hypothetical protein